MKSPAEMVTHLLAGSATGYSAIDAAIERGDIRLEDVAELMTAAIDGWREQRGIEVQLWQAERDGVRVLQVDTDRPGRLRINLNDAPIWDGDPSTDERPGAHFNDVWED